MVTDRVFALLAFGALFVFLGIVMVKVGRADLAVVVVLTLALAGYDLWRQHFARRP